MWLDLGSNLGIGVSSISPKANIIATDIDKRYLDAMEDGSTPRINMDATALPFKNESVNIISCFETIEHMPMTDVGNMLNEVKRVLKNDGILLLSTPNREANGNAKMSPDHKQEFTHPELYTLLKTYGFEVQEEYGQNFIKDNNLLHQLFRSLRENYVVRNMYNKLPSFIVKAVRDTSLQAFGDGEVRVKKAGETERVMYFICRKSKNLS